MALGYRQPLDLLAFDHRGSPRHDPLARRTVNGLVV